MKLFLKSFLAFILLASCILFYQSSAFAYPWRVASSNPIASNQKIEVQSFIEKNNLTHEVEYFFVQVIDKTQPRPLGYLYYKRLNHISLLNSAHVEAEEFAMYWCNRPKFATFPSQPITVPPLKAPLRRIRTFYVSDDSLYDTQIIDTVSEDTLNE